MNARQWINELAAAKKREKDWREDGKRILEIYAPKSKGKNVPFNILFSNTETLLPSLYSAIPRPVVDRRFKDADPLGKAAAEAGRRCLDFLIDTNVEGYETYDEGMRAAVVDALLPGRGVTSLKYDAEIVGEDLEKKLPKAAKDAEESAEEDDAPVPYKDWEVVCVQSHKWDMVLFGYATKWSKVPWVAFGEYVDKAEVTKIAGKKVANALTYTEERDENEEKKPNDEDTGERRVTLIWRVWDKESRKVIFLSEHYKDAFLKVVDDPMELEGFFPIPKPIMLVEKANDLSPTALYTLYEKQAEELNSLSRRIIRIVHAIKARGIYDGELGDDIKTLMEADDNELVPADKNSSLAAEKGLQNAIWFMPIEQLVKVLRELLAAREACKAVIWEIMGIADIMRGQSQASETLGAQQIKQSWGSLRLKRMQKEVGRYARDLLRIMLEVAVNKFSEDTWAKMTGLPYLTEQQAAEADAQLQATQLQMQMQPSGVDPNTGQPMPPDPSMQQKMQQAQAEAAKPRWKDVLGLLKNDLQRAYRIDIETNSTVEPEAADDQKQIAELMNAMGQYFAGVTPLIEKGFLPFDAAKEMLLEITRRFRFGTNFEDKIKAMQAPQPKEDPKIQMEREAHQADMQAKQLDQQAKQGELGLKAQIEERKAQLEMQKMQMEMEFAQQEHALKMAEIQAKSQQAQIVNASKMRVAQQTAAIKERQVAMQAAKPEAAPQ